MRAGDISASVEVDGTPLKEYGTKTQSDGKTVSSFLPSEEGQRFVISCANSSPKHSYRLDIMIDGRCAERLSVCAGSSSVVLGLRTEGTAVVRPFIFSRLALKEADDDGASGISPSKIGTIEIYAWRAVEVSKRTNLVTYDIPEVGAVNERSKKLGGHCVAFGSAIRDERCASTFPVIMKCLDPKDRPRCVLIFTYRPYDVLRAQGMIVPEPTRARRDEGSSQPALRKPGRTDAQAAVGPSKITARKRAATQSEQDDGLRPGPSKRARQSDEATHVKQEAEPDPESDGSEDLEAQLDLVASSFQAQMAALREKIQHKKAKKAARPTNVKREQSPIRMPSNVSGAVVDLTSD